MQKTRYKLIKEDGYLLLIFFLMSISILIKSHYNNCGSLSFDSIGYLELAKNLVNDEGFYGPYNWHEEKDTYFSIQPIGYPYTIYLTAKLTGLSVFWASKILNMFLVGSILHVFRLLFNKNAYLFGLILLFASFIEIYSYTWSETLFISSLVWFSTSIYFFFVTEKKPFISASLLIISSVILFLSRYIGAFSVGLIGVLGVFYVIKKNTMKASILFTIVVINLLIISTYLYINYIETGYITGAYRRPATSGNLKLLKNLFKAIITESVIPFNDLRFYAKLFLFCQCSILTYTLLKYKNAIIKPLKASKINDEVKIGLIFAIVGVTYLFFIIVFRWNLKFNWWGFRLLGPSSFMLFIASLIFMKNYTRPLLYSNLKKIWIALAIISWIINVPYHTYMHSGTRNCEDFVLKAKELYSESGEDKFLNKQGK